MHDDQSQYNNNELLPASWEMCLYIHIAFRAVPFEVWRECVILIHFATAYYLTTFHLCSVSIVENKNL